MRLKGFFNHGIPLHKIFSRSNHNHATIPPVLVEVKNGVRKIMFNRPEKKNAVTTDMFKSFLLGMKEANKDDSTVLVAVTGSGDYFTSGIDLSPQPKLKGPPSSSNEPPKPRKKGEGVAKLVSAILDCRKPIIALVNGPAVGFGVTLLGLCDTVYASDRATFHTKFTRFGLPPELASTYNFPRMMGYGKASNMLLFNQPMKAEEAFHVGLVSRVIPHDNFAKETTALLEEYGQLPVKSLMYSKDLVKSQRYKDLVQKASEHEQSHFDPEQAKKIIMEFLMNKKDSL